MRVTNVHRRTIDDVDAVADLIDALAGDDDRLWPRDRWPAMRLDRSLQVGAQGGHGPIRYWVDLYDPGRRARFRFERPRGLGGFHEFVLLHGGGRPAELVHVLEARLTGTARVTWPLLYRPLHDALIEDALDNATRTTKGWAEQASWSRYVRFLRQALARRHESRPPLPALPEACCGLQAMAWEHARGAHW